MKVLVCGGRDYKDARTLQRVLDALHAQFDFTCVIHGAQRGADLLAENWARARELKYVGIPAQWKKQRKSGGPIRNRRMLVEERPDMIVAFPGHIGTPDMVARAMADGISERVPTGEENVFAYRRRNLGDIAHAFATRA